MERILLYLLCFKCCRQCAHQAEETSRAGKFNFIVDYKMSWSICTQGQTSEPLLMCVCVWCAWLARSTMRIWERALAKPRRRWWRRILADVFSMRCAPKKVNFKILFISSGPFQSMSPASVHNLLSLSLSHVSFAHTLSRQGNSNVLSVSFTVFFFDVVLVGWCCVQPFPLHYHFGNDDKRD